MKTVLAIMVLGTAFGAAGATYFVDAVTGSDSFNGTNSSSAWQTLTNVNGTTFASGDRILFKRNCAWTGQLNPTGSGAAGAPIIIDAYGVGALPQINGGGIDGPAVLLYNVQYWEVTNLDISNPAGTDSINRVGIRVFNNNLAPANHIYLRGLTVHDVRGNNDFSTGKMSGGIQITCSTNAVSYNDVLVESCVVHDVTREGIAVNGAKDVMALPSLFGSNIQVRFNTVFNVGGDAIVVRCSKGPIVERNVAHDFSDGLWARSCDGAVFQYNEAYRAGASGDGFAFDSDLYSINTVIQYNYSHENSGGFLELLGNGANCVARYNISQNERAYGVWFSGVPPNSQIYNNTFYIGAGSNVNIFLVSGDTPANHTYFFNNLVYNLGSGNYQTLGGLTAGYNCFYGNHPSGEPVDPQKITSDPQLVNPGSGAIGIGTLAGYQLQLTSPCIGAGAQISDSGGRDFWGTPVVNGQTDVGASQHIQMTTSMNLNIRVVGAGTLELSANVVPYWTYTVHYKANLNDSWQPLTNVTANTAGAWTIDLPLPPSATFYRWAYP